MFYIGRATPGQPTILAPAEKPTPRRAAEPMDGANISRREKVAAAIKAMVKTSSSEGFLDGISSTAIPTIEPSRTYLIMRTRISLPSTEKLLDIFCIF